MKRRFFVVLAAMGLVALLVPTISSAATKGKAIQKVPVRMSEFAFQAQPRSRLPTLVRRAS